MEDKFELSIKSTEEQKRASVKIVGRKKAIMNALANLVVNLKEQEILDETDIKVAVAKGLKYKEEANDDLEKSFDELFKHILNL